MTTASPNLTEAGRNERTGSVRHGLAELDREARMGTSGSETDTREVRRIDLSDFEVRRDEITEQLWSAATDIGFFQLVHHGIPKADIDAAFARAAQFFALPTEAKARLPHSKANNVGWESLAQVRPSVGTPDQKESYQVTRPFMQDLWPTETELPGFQADTLRFESQCWAVAMRVLSCFATKLGFEREFFTTRHDPASPQYQSTLRLLHYFAMPAGDRGDSGLWRAGAHTDFDCLTLLFQRAGQGGLQVCPGKDIDAPAWTPVEPADEVITCNIGDMLMRWSDDLLPSNFHRVKSPQPHEYQGARYSIAFFAQANRDAVIAGPAGKYAPITAADYLKQRIAANFTAA